MRVSHLRKIIALVVLCVSVYLGLAGWALFKADNSYAGLSGMLMAVMGIGGVFVAALIAFGSLDRSERKMPWWWDFVGIGILVIVALFRELSNR